MHEKLTGWSSGRACWSKWPPKSCSRGFNGEPPSSVDGRQEMAVPFRRDSRSCFVLQWAVVFDSRVVCLVWNCTANVQDLAHTEQMLLHRATFQLATRGGMESFLFGLVCCCFLRQGLPVTQAGLELPVLLLLVSSPNTRVTDTDHCFHQPDPSLCREACLYAGTSHVELFILHI